MGFLSPKRPDTSAADAAVKTDLELQKEQFEYAKGVQEPFLRTGLAGQSRIAELLGLDIPSSGNVSDPLTYNTADMPLTAERSADFGSLARPFQQGDLQNDEGYQFRLAEGEKAINRAGAARGAYFDPSTVKALGSYNQGMASDEYLNAYNRYNADQSNLYNRLAGLSGVGQQAGQQLTNAGQNFAAGSSNAVNNYANVKGAAAQQAGQRSSSMWQGLIGTGAQLYAASDMRLKKDVKKIDEVDGVNVYEFRYNSDPENRLYSGVMAQEVQEDYPGAIHTDELTGMMKVNYNLLPVDFAEIKSCH